MLNLVNINFKKKIKLNYKNVYLCAVGGWGVGKYYYRDIY